MENLRLAEEPNGSDSIGSAAQGNVGSAFNCDNTQVKNLKTAILIQAAEIPILH